MHCVHWPTQSITRHLAGEKALSQGGCFLVLPALLFQRAPGRPCWWTLWSSLAGSSGTLFNLPSPPSPVSTLACFTHLMFAAAPSFVPAVLCTLTMMTTVPAWILPCKVAQPSETSRTSFQVPGSQGVDDYVLKTNAGKRRDRWRVFRL